VQSWTPAFAGVTALAAWEPLSSVIARLDRAIK